MASIKQLQTRKYKITVSNGYRPDGRKISRAKTITVPDTVRKQQIPSMWRTRQRILNGW